MFKIYCKLAWLKVYVQQDMTYVGPVLAFNSFHASF